MKKKTSKKTKESKFHKGVREAQVSLLHAHVLAIDPGSNFIGVAQYSNGELIESRRIRIQGDSNNEKIKWLQNWCKGLMPHVLVIEDIPVPFNRYPGVAELQRAIGVITASINYAQIVEVHPKQWKANLDKFPDYKKGDEWDARLIGYTAIEHARTLQAEGT